MIKEFWIRNQRKFAVYKGDVCIAQVSDKNVALRLAGYNDLKKKPPHMIIHDGAEYLLIKHTQWSTPL